MGEWRQVKSPEHTRRISLPCCQCRLPVLPPPWSIPPGHWLPGGRGAHRQAGLQGSLPARPWGAAPLIQRRRL